MIVKNAIENQSMPMESILTRDQRTTSHRVHDHAMRINALTSKSAISLLQQTKYQNNIVASCHCIKAITATTLKREKKSDSHLMPTFYHDRRTRHSNASFSVLRSLSKSKLPSYIRIQLQIIQHALDASNGNCKRANEHRYYKC